VRNVDELLSNTLELARQLPLGKIPELMERLATIQITLATRWAAETNHREEHPSEIDRLLTVEEAAKRLAFTSPYLYELIRQDRFPVLVCGKYKRIRERDISAWIEQNRRNVVDNKVYATYNNDNDDRRRAQENKKTAGTYTSRIRGPRRRRAKLDSPTGTGRNGNSGTAGKADTAICGTSRSSQKDL
jgi:excisionase family DNA binding protein